MLSKLHLHRTHVTDAGLVHLASLTQLTALQLNYNGATQPCFEPYRLAEFKEIIHRALALP